ncbi:uncharacterized protein PGTG_09418 [Puccinia graminis f. sp. tritici CRL 75-36-700-3]|uniref:Uncharacterized protein n=1 Tax=Puccinia graminis f. sp. tritici (strain CRL 75-36-700-3 / race SCCL) TaxID=418459 RepID=E3KHD0_PUCGT|nr:uncharacterized protein PGTG_09418 [Puccinia graminis f. sp. tritici CRL 75-36-700-3]EFP83705.1 hypothetical protein PGTG_09418 [Puccinia graminis f. sp. tritici CRL 75-36-700-3]
MLLLTLFRYYSVYFNLRATEVSAANLPDLKSILWEDSTANSEEPLSPSHELLAAFAESPFTNMLDPMDWHRTWKTHVPLISYSSPTPSQSSASSSTSISRSTFLQGMPQSWRKDAMEPTYDQEPLSITNPTASSPSPSHNKRRKYPQEGRVPDNLNSGQSSSSQEQSPRGRKAKSNLIKSNNLSYMPQNENIQVHSELPTPVIDNSPEIEILTGILGNGHHEVSQPPVANSEPDFETLPRRRSVIKPHLPPGNYFSSRGQLHLQLLREFWEAFRTKVRSKQFDVSTHWTLAKGDDHPDLPFAMIGRPFGSVGKVFRVLRGSSGNTQGSTALGILYKFLIGWIYFQHEELLNRSDLDIPVFAYRLQQQNLLSWLEKEIFEPDNSLPIVGLVNSYPLRWQDEKIGPIQTILIRYFSQDEREEVSAPTTATEILNEFYAQGHRFDHLAATYRLGVSTKVTTSLDFQDIVSFLLCLIEEDGDARNSYFMPGRINPVSLSGSEVRIFSWYDSVFEGHCDRAGIGDYRLKSMHPKLPMAMYFFNNKSAFPVVRVLRKSERSPLTTVGLVHMFKKLIKAINYLHIEVLERLKIDESEFSSRGINLFQWLFKSIAHPDGSIPVIGIIKIKNNLAPWDDMTDGVLRSFGQVQLKLIEYFSNDDTEFNLKDAASFITTSWFQDHLPKDFLNLAQISIRLMPTSFILPCLETELK